MSKILHLEGERFGRLKVYRKSNKQDSHHNTWWICQCDCGKAVLATTTSLRQGVKRSCGCLASENGKRLAALAREAKFAKRKSAAKING